MVEVYIQIFDEIWALSPTPVSTIFSSLPWGKEIGVKIMEFFLRGKEIWVKMMEFFFFFFFFFL